MEQRCRAALEVLDGAAVVLGAAADLLGVRWAFTVAGALLIGLGAGAAFLAKPVRQP